MNVKLDWTTDDELDFLMAMASLKSFLNDCCDKALKGDPSSDEDMKYAISCLGALSSMDTITKLIQPIIEFLKDEHGITNEEES